MLYEPSYLQPSFTSIDATEQNTFSCIINAESDTRLTGYRIDIYSLESQLIYYQEDYALSSNLYNGDRLVVSIPENEIVNGEDYLWSITLHESSPTRFVAKGVTNISENATKINIMNHFAVVEGMYLKIDGELRQITNYQKVDNGDDSYGIAIVTPAFPSTPIQNKYYEVFTNFITSEETFFKARKTPVVNIENGSSLGLINNKEFTFKGEYYQEQGVPRKYFVFNLYNKKGELLETSGEQYSGALEWRVDGFLNNTPYFIELIVENQNGVTKETPRYPFLVNYGAPLSATLDASLLEHLTAIAITWDYTNPLVDNWYLYKVDSYSHKLSFVASCPSATCRIVDYKVANNIEYTYLLMGMDSEKVVVWLQSSPITTKWWNWCLIGLVEDGEDYRVNLQEIWKFDLNLQSNDLKQNLEKHQLGNLTQFPKIASGKKNYLSGGITALIGEIVNNEYVDTVERQEDFRKFVANGEIKLLKDRKGGIYLVKTTQNTFNYLNEIEIQPLTISFEFVEVNDVNRYSIIE